MANNSQTRNGDNDERMLHVRMSADTHRRVRIQAAEQDVTIQDWVTEVIERELNRLESVKKGRDK